MRLENLETRATSANDIASQLRASAQASIKSFSSRLSSTFGSALSEFAAREEGAGGTPNSGSLRQNLVASLSNSRPSLAALASTPVTPAIVTTPASSSTTSTTESGLQSLVDAADRTASGTPTPSSPSPAGSTPSPVVSSQSPAANTPTDTTPPNGPAAPPTTYSMTQTLSSDPTVFTTGNYSEQLLYSSYLQQANDENNLRYQNYMNEYQNWQLNGSQGQPPAAPVYETIDQNAFGQWYTQELQNTTQGVNAPDVSMFMANGPDYGNGYYGAPGTFQVGTLYNPTGPATPSQISAAGGSPSPNVKNS